MNSTQKVTILALGGAGVRMLKRLNEIKGDTPLTLLAYDTDRRSLEDLQFAPDRTLLADEEWRSGNGCGGNMLDGQRSASRERPRISRLIADSQLLLVIGGMGGGTASGAAGVVASVARQNDIPTIFLLTLPFSMEGHRKRKLAEDAIEQELRPVNDTLLLLPNDLLFSLLPADTSLANAFSHADDAVAHAVLSLALMLTGCNLLTLDQTLFASTLRERKNLCSIGFGFADANDPQETRCELALERLLDAPLLGGITRLQKADAVIVSMLGSSDLDIGGAKRTLEQLSERINPTANTLIGLGSVLSGEAKRMVCAIAIRYDLREQVETAAAPAPRKKSARKQQNENFDDMLPGITSDNTIHCGIFANTVPFTYKSENLDMPTFHRKGIFIRIE